MRYFQSIGISILLLFLLSMSALATPSPFLDRSEYLLGSNKKYFFTFVKEKEHPGSHYRYTVRQYVNTYSADTGKLMESERVLETDYHRHPDDGKGWQRQVKYKKEFDLNEHLCKHRVVSACQEDLPEGVRMKLAPEGLVLERGKSRLTLKPKENPEMLLSPRYLPSGETRICSIHRDWKNFYFSIRQGIKNREGDYLEGVISVAAGDYTHALEELLKPTAHDRALVPESKASERVSASRKKYYSIQIIVLPLSEKKAGFAAYEYLKEKGYLIYYYKVEVKGSWWMRIKVGVFPSISEAEGFGDKFKKKEDFDFVVTKADIFVDALKDKFARITTPSAIWIMDGDLSREVFQFDNTETEKNRRYLLDDRKLNSPFLLNDTRALLSPDGKEFVFHYGPQTYSVTIKSGMVTAKPRRTKDGLCIAKIYFHHGLEISSHSAKLVEVPNGIEIIARDGTALHGSFHFSDRTKSSMEDFIQDMENFLRNEVKHVLMKDTRYDEQDAENINIYPGVIGNDLDGYWISVPLGDRTQTFFALELRRSSGGSYGALLFQLDKAGHDDKSTIIEILETIHVHLTMEVG